MERQNMNANGNLIETLEHSGMYREYVRAFSEATGLPVTLRSSVTWRLPFSGRRKENSFCALIGSRSRTCAGCLQLQEKLSQSASANPASVTCPYGLCETAVPIRLGNKTIGFLQTGQVMRRKPTLKQFNDALKKLEVQGLEVEPEAVKKAYFQTPVVSRKRLDSVTHLLSIFADHLAMKGNQIAMQQANAEPPVITKAKQYIHEHHTEELSLGRVASAVHTSTFYFCKLFKKITGVNFTEFVSRVRAEKAKNLLLNPNLRVSEIAYEVGFQSLTHFNRIFRRVMGQSPTEYRAQLPKTA